MTYVPSCYPRERSGLPVIVTASTMLKLFCLTVPSASGELTTSRFRVVQGQASCDVRRDLRVEVRWAGEQDGYGTQLYTSLKMNGFVMCTLCTQLSL